MDLELILLIPIDQIAGLNLTEITASWGGQVFSRSPREFRYGDSLHFTESADLQYYKKRLNGRLDLSGWTALYLMDNPLADISYQLHTETFCPHTCPLVNLIHRLYAALNTFCLIKFLYEEELHHTYVPKDAEEAVLLLLQSLDWEDPAGIILLKNA